MIDFLRFFLPIYLMLFFGVAFVAKSILVAKEIGKSPLVLPKDDSAYGLIGNYFKIEMLLMLVYVFVFAYQPKSFVEIESPALQKLGILLMIISLVWVIIAQAQMKTSWRIGIDTETKTELVTSGLFKISRNPIFFGMIISLVGLFLSTPNVFTVIFLIIGYILIQIQIRMEEEFLAQLHGPSYLQYKAKVRRFI